MKILKKNPQDERSKRFLEILKGPALIHYTWTEADKEKFYEGLAKYGKDFKMIHELIGTKDLR